MWSWLMHQLSRVNPAPTLPGPVPSQPRRRNYLALAPGRRNYEMSLTDRLTADWPTMPRSGDTFLRYGLRTMRARARHLEQNDSYHKRFYSLLKKNVVGDQGIRLQMRAKETDGTTDKVANDQIEEAWRDWGAVGICTMDGRYSWRDVLDAVVHHIARDGEILVREIRGRTARNEFGYALQLIEADHLDDQLRERIYINNEDRGVKMGVEMDEWQRPLGYWIRIHHPGDEFFSNEAVGRRVRIPAEEMMHLYLPLQTSSTRGVPWVHAAALNSHHLDKYIETEQVAARVGASKMGFFIGDGEGYEGDDEDHQAEESTGTLPFDASPGQFDELPAGTEFKEWNPQHPNNAFESFTKTVLHGVAAGLDLSYATLSTDLASVNFSSLRHAALDERDTYRGIQTWLVQHFCQRVFSSWLTMSMTTGAVPLPLAKFTKFNRGARWQPRGWSWVNPLQEVQAEREAVEGTFKSRGAVIRERGGDRQDTWEELEEEQLDAEEKNIPLEAPRDRLMMPGGDNA